MNKRKLLWVSASVIALAGLGYLGYYFYKKSKTTSQDPDKNNRKIIITKG
jgi:uncharacterized membrane protein YebE (DUF533 family)